MIIRNILYGYGLYLHLWEDSTMNFINFENYNIQKIKKYFMKRIIRLITYTEDSLFILIWIIIGSSFIFVDRYWVTLHSSNFHKTQVFFVIKMENFKFISPFAWVTIFTASRTFTLGSYPGRKYLPFRSRVTLSIIIIIVHSTYLLKWIIN